MFRLILWLACLLPQFLVAQLLYSVTDAPTLGQAGAGVAATGIPALWLNPAGIAVGQRLGFGATLTQRYGLGELTTASGGVVYRGFGLQVATLGYGDYRASRFGMVYARQLSDRWRIGAELVLLRELILGYGGGTQLMPALGVQYTAGRGITLGVTVKNPTGASDTNTRIGVGCSYMLSEHVSLLADAQIHLQARVISHLGIAYSPVTAIRLHFGYASNPGTLAVGATYRFAGDFSVAVAGSHHTQLGSVAGAGVYRSPLAPVR